MEQQKLNAYYLRITNIWKKFCELHDDLLNKTLDEYQLLMESKVDDLAKLVESKELVIRDIADIEVKRADLINELNEKQGMSIQNVTDLLIFFQNQAIEKEHKYLYKYNKLLIDIIEKIQAQNKSNQLFINKALLNLRNMREDLSGSNTYSTYNANGTENRQAGKMR